MQYNLNFYNSHLFCTSLVPVGEKNKSKIDFKVKPQKESKVGYWIRQRQSAVESWLLEHAGLVLMGPCTLNDRLLWLLSVGISLCLFGFPRKPLRWNSYKLNWGFTIAYTVCSIVCTHTQSSALHCSLKRQKGSGTFGWQNICSSIKSIFLMFEYCLYCQ